MNSLENGLKQLLASVYALQLKAHGFHWNVVGPDFYQYHKFLDELVHEVWDSVDGIAEHIRQLDMLVPASFKRYAEMSIVKDQLLVPDAHTMLTELLYDNEKIIDLLDAIYPLCNGHIGLENFIQDRSASHSKWGWQLQSLVKIPKAAI